MSPTLETVILVILTYRPHNSSYPGPASYIKSLNITDYIVTFFNTLLTFELSEKQVPIIAGKSKPKVTVLRL